MWACVSSVIQTNKYGERLRVCGGAAPSKGCALPITFPYHLPAALSPCFLFTLSGQIRLITLIYWKIAFFFLLLPHAVTSGHWTDSSRLSSAPQCWRALTMQIAQPFPRLLLLCEVTGCWEGCSSAGTSPGREQVSFSELNGTGTAGLGAGCSMCLEGSRYYLLFTAWLSPMGFCCPKHYVDCCITLFSCTDAFFPQAIHLAAQIPSSKEIKTHKDQKKINMGSESCVQ